MQMRPGDAASGAHSANALAGLHGIADLHLDGAQVARHGQQPAAVV